MTWSAAFWRSRPTFEKARTASARARWRRRSDETDKDCGERVESGDAPQPTGRLLKKPLDGVGRNVP